MFGRQAYVCPSNDRSGTVMLDRQYDSVVDYLPQTIDNTDRTIRRRLDQFDAGFAQRVGCAQRKMGST